MVFFAVLYPSVSIDEAVAVIIEVLNNDIDDLGERLKLILTVVHKLIKLFLSANYFIFDKLNSDWCNRGESRAAAAFKMGRFVIIANG